MTQHPTTPDHCVAPDAGGTIVVVGAGVVGLALAIALARAGYRVDCVGPAQRDRNGRTVALLDGSVRFLSAQGLWTEAAPMAAPLATMRLVDDTASLFRGPPVDFVAAELGLAAFGFNIENSVLLEVLEVAAAAAPRLRRHQALFASAACNADSVEVELSDGARLAGTLLVAADGARSTARASGGIGCRIHRYPQVALTATLDHTAPHRNVSTEFHTRQGPFTLVPMVPDAAAAHRSSIVWVMTPDEAERRLALDLETFAGEIERQSRRLLGNIRVRGAIGRVPITRLEADRLVGPRLVLVGEAAHALPPIGAQGLNLSLRDAACLVQILSGALRERRDPGSPSLLDAYMKARRGDIAVRTAGVDMLNRALISPYLPVDALRGAGLAALGAFRPLRRAVMRQGLSP